MTDITDLLIEEVKGLRSDVQELNRTVHEEREGRGRSDRAYKASRRAFAAAIGFILIMASGLLLTVAYQARQDAVASCETRIQSRKDIRAMGVALADGVADQLEAGQEDRVLIHNRAVQITLETLPPPDC